MALVNRTTRHFRNISAAAILVLRPYNGQPRREARLLHPARPDRGAA